MHIRYYLSTALSLAIISTAGFAQSPPKVPEAPNAVKAFDDVVRAAEKTIRGSKAYQVTAKGTWKQSSTGTERTGVNVVEITGEGVTKIRIVTSSPDSPLPQYTAVSDGKSLTRLFSAGKMASTTPVEATLHDLQSDALTVPALRTAGVEFLARPDIHGTILSQTARVEDQGITEMNGKKLHSFRVLLTSGKVVDVKFSLGDNSLPVEVKSVYTLPLDEKKSFTMELDTKLIWNLEPKIDDATFAVNVPKGYEMVDDITDEILGVGPKELLGNALPKLTFTGMDGKPVTLAKSDGKSVTVLYFWATWAGPSLAGIPSINQFVSDYSGKGVKFIAVNEGENQETVQAWITKSGYKGTVLLDPQGDATSTLRVRTPPSIVIIGPDGSLQAYHRGGKVSGREQIQKDLDALLKGEMLVPKK